MMGLAQMLRILRGRALLLLTVVFMVVAAVGVISFLSPKKYVSELALVVDLQGNDPMKQSALAPANWLAVDAVHSTVNP